MRGEALGAVVPGWCRVEAEFSGVSPGTERLVGAGRVPEATWGAMRCPYMGGSFAFPVKYGYSLVGRVVEGPPELEGRRVHLLHPHQRAAVVRVEDVSVVPEGISGAAATLASNMETAVTAVWDSEVTLGDRALVVGFGIIGALVARVLAGMTGVEVLVAEIDAEKRALAASMGLEAVAPEEVAAGSVDVALHASASSEGLQTAIDAVGLEGRVVELSWYGEAVTEVRLGGAFHHQRKQLVCSQVSRIPTRRAARWDHRRRKALVFRLLREPGWEACLTSRGRLEGLAAWFAGGGAGLAHVVEYG